MATRTALGTNNGGGAITTLSVAISTAINAGESVYVGAFIGGAPSGISCVCGADTFTLRVAQNNGLGLVFELTNAGAHAINTNVTLSWAGATSAAMWVSKWSVGTTFDKSASALGTSTAPASGATATTTAPVEIWLASIAVPAANVTFSAATGGFAIGQTVNSANGSIAELFQETSATGAANAGCTISSSQTWTAIVATYQEPQSGTLRVPNVETIPTLATVGSPA